MATPSSCKQMLGERGLEASVRTVQRTVEDERRKQRVAQVATVRFETEPGAQMQVDFGEKWVVIAGQLVRVFLLVAVLSYSRRLFAKALLNQRSDDWREGIAAAFRHFGGVTRTILGDNAKALVVGRDRAPALSRSIRRPSRSVAIGASNLARADRIARGRTERARAA